MFFSKLFKNGSSKNAVLKYAIETTGLAELQDLIFELESYANEVKKVNCVIEPKSDLKYHNVLDQKDRFRAVFGLDVALTFDSEKSSNVLNDFNAVESAYGGIISLKKATKGILQTHNAVVESLQGKNLPIASDDVAILVDFQIMSEAEVDLEYVAQGICVFMIDVYKTMPMITSAKKTQGRVFDATECDLEIDDLQVGDIIKGYIWGGSGYYKNEIDFKFDGINITPATKADWGLLAKCWYIDKDACEDLVDFANEGSHYASTAIGLLTSTENLQAATIDDILEDADSYLDEDDYERLSKSRDAFEFADVLGLVTIIGRGKKIYYIVSRNH